MKNYEAFAAKFTFLRSLLEATLQRQPAAIQQSIRVDLLAPAERLVADAKNMSRSEVRALLTRLAERAWVYAGMSRFDANVKQSFSGATGIILGILVKLIPEK